MFCSKCGSQNEDNAASCVSCGSPLAAAGSPGDGAQGPAPSNLATSIIVTILCCWPVGIPAIVFAAQAMSNNSAGNYSAAWAASKKSKMWSWIAFGLGLIVGVGYGIAVAAGP